MDYNELISTRNLVITRINKLLEEPNFELSKEYLMYLHEYIFNNINYMQSPGKFRDHNVFKNEPTLNGVSIDYADFHTIEAYLKYDFDKEKEFFANPSQGEELLEHMAKFSSSIWHTHAFSDGNTRTVSVLIQKYLKVLGYPTNTDEFRFNNGFYRHALVRSVYSNSELGIENDFKPLILFYDKMINSPKIHLDDSMLIVPELFDEKNQKILKRVK